jgi:hypothetical protein
VSPATCCTPTTESVEYTFENANLTGIGVFDNDTDNLVQFRGVVSDSAALTVTLNATDNTIVLSFDPDALVADIPDATTTERGILETATNAEAIAKAAADKTLTPSNLAALGSTTTFAGLVELATNAETITGTSTTLAVTPAGLAATLDGSEYVLFADFAERSGATPAFVGQLGVQEDAGLIWVGSGVAPGDFDIAAFMIGTIQATNATTTVLGLETGSTLEITSTDNTGSVLFSCAVTFSTGVTASLSGVTDFTTNGTIYKSGVIVPANSVLTTDGTAGRLASSLIASFLSTANVQSGWGTPSGTLARTTFAAYAGQTVSNPPTQAEVQAIDDALVIVSRRLAALITDILAVNLPAA